MEKEESVSVIDATHVKVGNRIKKIRSKWGIYSGIVAKPSEGGYGVVTEDGVPITMWEADSFLKIDS